MQGGNVAGVRMVPQFVGRKILMSSGRPLDPVSCVRGGGVWGVERGELKYKENVHVWEVCGGREGGGVHVFWEVYMYMHLKCFYRLFG